MKLAFLGNMNSMPVVYARELREMGHEVHFYVDAIPSDWLNRPERRYPEYAAYPDWMIEHPVPLPLVRYGLARIFLRPLIARLRAGHYDGIILNGPAISLAAHLDPPCFAILGGADLDVLCDSGTVTLARLTQTFGRLSALLRYPIYRRFIPKQRRGVRACSGFNYFPRGIQPGGDALLDDIYRGLTPYRLQIRGADVSQHDYRPPSDRRGDDAVILVPVRFLWRTPLPAGFSEQENKRNDIILRGIAAFMHSSGRFPKVVLVEKGPDVGASKALVTELGIADRLTWLGEMPMSEIFQWYERADIVFDQLGEHVMGAVTLDAMLTGRPVITNARPEIFDPLIPEPSAICHARSTQEVASWLHRLVDDPELRRKIGLRSREYVRCHFAARQTAEAIAAHFQSAGAARHGR